MDINKETLPLFRKDFSDAVRKLEEKYEVKISLGMITYSENTFSCKMEVRNGRRPPERLKRRGFRDVRRFASYPECHRFESYLSHARKPRNFNGCGAFSCSCVPVKKCHFVPFSSYSE